MLLKDWLQRDFGESQPLVNNLILELRRTLYANLPEEDLDKVLESCIPSDYAGLCKIACNVVMKYKFEPEDVRVCLELSGLLLERGKNPKEILRDGLRRS